MKIKINPEIFRAYDIRGIYPSTINEEAAFLIGQAFVKFLKKPRPNIVVGRDGRLSSPVLFKALTKGIIDQGGSIIDIGLAITPMLYFTVAHFKFDGGINITASHLPSEYNGFKLVREKAIPISSETGLEEIKKLAIKEKFLKLKEKKGKILRKNIISDYLDFNLKDFKIPTFKSLKLVIDTANAVPGILTPHLKKRIPAQIYPLFEKLDGNFPNHNPDPLIKENLKSLQKEVKNKKVDLGVAFDGDGDRIIFVDEKAQVISGDLVTALISKILLKERMAGRWRPKKKILYDIRSSNIVPETIKKSGGIPIPYRIGHALIKEKMRSQNIFFAGELSGHYYHKSHYFCETPLFVLFGILEEISKSGKDLSELIKPFKRYFHTGEINFKVKDKEKTLKLIERKFKNGQISHLDGLRINFKDWWFLARPSGTEDLLRLTIEAKTKKLMLQKKKELSSLIKG